MKRPRFSLRTLLLLMLILGAAGGLALPKTVGAFRAWHNPSPIPCDYQINTEFHIR